MWRRGVYVGAHHVGFDLVAMNAGVRAGVVDGVQQRKQFGGAITDLSDTSISLHDGNRDLTCAIDSTSPSVASLKVGMHVRVSCAGGTLVPMEVDSEIAPPPGIVARVLRFLRSSPHGPSHSNGGPA